MKRSLTVTALLLVAMTVVAQDVEYNITGEVRNSLDRMYLYSMGFYETIPIDSVDVTEGTFSFHGMAQKDELLAVGDSDRIMPFFNDGTPIKMIVHDNVEDDHVVLAIFEFTEASEQNIKLCQVDVAVGNMLSATQGAEGEELSYLEYATANAERELLLENRESLIPVAFLSDIIDVVDYDSLAILMDTTSVYFSHPVMRDIYDYYLMIGKRRLGIPYHDASLKDVYGREHRLSDYCGRGNYVLLDFWASWCTPCLREIPILKQLYSKYHEKKNFEIVGVSLDNDAKAWQGSIQRLGLQWPQLTDLMVREGEAVQKYGVVNIPANVLLDPEGKIIGIDLKGEDLTEYIAELME